MSTYEAVKRAFLQAAVLLYIGEREFDEELVKILRQDIHLLLIDFITGKSK